MKILALSTRDYYDLVSSEKWEEVKCPKLATFISGLYDNISDETEDEILQDFFIQDEEGERFWEENTKPFSMIKRFAGNSDFCIYIIPCIPRMHLEGNMGKCKFLKTRHDYIGNYLHAIIEDNGGKVEPGNLFVAVHDLDIFLKNDERNLRVSDVEPKSELDSLIKNNILSPENIFGFQHENKQNSFYTLFNQKLGREELSSDVIDNIIKRIRSTAGEKENKVFLTSQDSESKLIATANPVSPIIFTFAIDNEGRFSCTIPEEFKKNENIEYSLLVECVKDVLKDTILKCNFGSYSAHLLIHHIEEVRGYANRHEQYVFGQNYFKESQSYFPIIHFCDASLDELANQFRYAQVIDSSIWNYFVQFDSQKDTSKFSISKDNSKLLRRVIECIAYNSNRCLYDLVVAQESADLVARLTYNAYIRRFKETEGHGDYVSPFVFHSEQIVDNLLVKKEFVDTNKIQEIKSFKWRILLVDDKSITKMGTNKSEELLLDNLPFNCKVTIILGVLKRHFFDNIIVKSWDDDSDVKQNADLLIEYAQTKEDCLRALMAKKYDIILLDYLLDKAPNGTHNYGYQILDDIYKFCDPKAGKEQSVDEIKYDLMVGPNERFFFMFTSAYSSAVNDRLLAEGLNLSEKYWFVSLGACPTNTPQLFLYNLLKLMEKRLDDSGILKLSSNEIYELVNKIYLPQEKDFPRYDPVRKRANALYPKVLSLQYHYRNILKDVEIPFGNSSSDFDTNGSVLMTHFIQKKVNLGGMLEHLTQLVHLTAFGTVRQWPEMWEEYIYFKAQFEKQVEIDDDSVDTKTLFSYIEKYILDLKSQQR